MKKVIRGAVPAVLFACFAAGLLTHAVSAESSGAAAVAVETMQAVDRLTTGQPPTDDYIRSRVLTVTSLMLSAAIGVATVFTVGWLLQGDGSDGWLGRLPVAIVGLGTGVAVFVLLLHYGDRRHGVHWRTRTLHVAPLGASPERLQLSVGRCLRFQRVLPPKPAGAASLWIRRNRYGQPEAYEGGSVDVHAFDPLEVFVRSVPAAVPLATGSVALGLDSVPAVADLSAPPEWEFRQVAVFFHRGGPYEHIHGQGFAHLNVDRVLRPLFRGRPRAVLVAVMQSSHSGLSREQGDIHTLCQELSVQRDLPRRRTLRFAQAEFPVDGSEIAGRQALPKRGLVITEAEPLTIVLETATYLVRREPERVLEAALHLGIIWTQAAPGIPMNEEVVLHVEVQDSDDDAWLPVARIFQRPVQSMTREALIAEAQAWETFGGDPRNVRRQLPTTIFPAGKNRLAMRFRCAGDGAVARVTAPEVSARLACEETDTDEDSSADE